jgi:hypothetical protein
MSISRSSLQASDTPKLPSRWIGRVALVTTNATFERNQSRLPDEQREIIIPSFDQERFNTFENVLQREGVLPVIPRTILDPIQNLEIINDEHYLIASTRENNFVPRTHLHTELRELLEKKANIQMFNLLSENPEIIVQNLSS